MKGRLKDLTFGRMGEQILTIVLKRDYRASFDELKDFDISVEIKKWREPRSRDANAYFHVLVNKIADASGQSDDEVKKALVLEYGALARDDDGNIVGTMLPAKVNVDRYYPYAKWYKSMSIEGKEYSCYLFYKHSADLDTKEMSRLIDGAIWEARKLGIDTDTPEQIARYKGEWKGQ